MLLETLFLVSYAVDLQEITISITMATELLYIRTIYQYNGFLIHFLVLAVILKKLLINVAM